MFIVMAIETEQLPVTAVRWVIVMIMVLMMNRELPQIFAAKFAATTCAYFGVQLERLRPVALLALLPLASSHLNNAIRIGGAVTCFLWRHACTLQVAATIRQDFPLAASALIVNR